jgi:hypothetical protein
MSEIFELMICSKRLCYLAPRSTFETYCRCIREHRFVSYPWHSTAIVNTKERMAVFYTQVKML